MQSPQNIVAMPSSRVQTQVSIKRAKDFLVMGSIQVIMGILMIFFNIGASVVWAEIAVYYGPDYWCGALVSLCFRLVR